jgi:hypothetical protein
MLASFSRLAQVTQSREMQRGCFQLDWIRSDSDSLAAFVFIQSGMGVSVVGLNQRLFEYASPGFDPSDMAQEEAIFTGILKQQNPNDSNRSH